MALAFHRFKGCAGERQQTEESQRPFLVTAICFLVTVTFGSQREREGEREREREREREIFGAESFLLRSFSLISFSAPPTVVGDEMLKQCLRPNLIVNTALSLSLSLKQNKTPRDGQKKTVTFEPLFAPALAQTQTNTYEYIRDRL
jgi:hypothetical protein